MPLKKKFKYVIITDENGKPMAYSDADKKLCFCTDEFWEDEPWPVKCYTIAKARRLIEKSKAYRTKNRLSETLYKLIPFDLPLRLEFKFTNRKIINDGTIT